MSSSEPAIDKPPKLSCVVVSLYLMALALLPFAWFPPFPWLHEHAQWSDAIFGAAAVAWLIERWRSGTGLAFRPAHIAIAGYFVSATLSLVFAAPDPRAGAPKLLGVGELCMLALMTSDFASRPGLSSKIARAVALTSVVTGAAAVVGLVMFYAGVSTRLVGIYGELQPSSWYARIQAATRNPNMLASFCIFASAVVARRQSTLPTPLRRAAQIALWVTVLLTFSRGILGFIVAAFVRNAVTPRGRRIAAAVSSLSIALLVVATLWKPTLDPTHPLNLHFEQVTSSRLQAAKTSLVTLASHPILGSGLGTNPGLYLGAPFDAHLTPLNVAATLGIPALVALVVLITSLWRRRRRPTDLAVWGGLAGLAVDGLAQDIEDFRHVWVMIGLADAEPGNAGKEEVAE